MRRRTTTEDKSLRAFQGPGRRTIPDVLQSARELPGQDHGGPSSLSRPVQQTPLRPRPPLLPLSAAHSARERAELSLCPIPAENCFRSYLPRAPPSSESKQSFPSQLVGRNYEHALRLRVGNVDDTEIPSRSRLPKSDSRTVVSGPVLAWSFEYIVDFAFVNAMLQDVRLSGGRLEIKANLHRQPHASLS